jgi:ferredoxin--NADP+ reductase
MHRIVSKETLGPDIHRYRITAPEVAKYRKPGQFVIVRVCEEGERIPLTIADSDPEAGTITLVVQAVGKSTVQMSEMQVGDEIPDVTGPLGRPTHIEKVGTVLCVGGGIGNAPLYPITKALREAGNHIISILGARSKDLLILEEEMRSVSDEVIITTDDGSYGMKGLVTDAIRMVVDRGEKVDQVFAIGPPVMMKFVSLLTKDLEIPTVVSLNPIMIDGTGMCGGCRVTVDGTTKFACVDGPEFDGHGVDFDELMQRLGTYTEHECRAMESYRECAGGGEER